MKPILYEICNIEHRYGARVALRLSTLTVAVGEALAVTGPNGVGKSTLLRLLGFLETPGSGRIDFHGPSGSDPRRQVTLLLQAPYLLKRSVLANVAYGLKVRNRTVNMEAETRAALEMVGLNPAAYARRRWFELSGGEAQRVALAARLVLKPVALLLDEPTSSLDQDSARAVRAAVIQARNRGTTLIIASHDHDWLKTVCDREVQLVTPNPPPV